MTKIEMIKRMVELQKQFMDYEHKDGMDPGDYYAPRSDHFLSGFEKEYNDLAVKLMNTAHAEVGSSR